MPKFLIEHTWGKERFEMPQAERDKSLKAAKAFLTTVGRREE